MGEIQKHIWENDNFLKKLKSAVEVEWDWSDFRRGREVIRQKGLNFKINSALFVYNYERLFLRDSRAEEVRFQGRELSRSSLRKSRSERSVRPFPRLPFGIFSL